MVTELNILLTADIINGVSGVLGARLFRFAIPKRDKRLDFCAEFLVHLSGARAAAAKSDGKGCVPTRQRPKRLSLGG
jgi:hypothetical protein